MIENFKDKWEESYARHENFIFYPKEESIKFLNRFVRKKVGIDKFVDIISFAKEVRGLEYGCGIGRIPILMREFGMDAYGVDISQNAINKAKEMAHHLGFADMENKFLAIKGEEIPFADNYFDITISESVLDSMSYPMAKEVMREIDRVTSKLAFISLISGDNDENYKEYNGEIIVAGQHENGTLQSYFNWAKIQELIKQTRFKVKWSHLIEEVGTIERYKNGRYYVVLEKANR